MSGSHTQSVRLVGDIGGTNARFAVLDEHGQPHKPSTLRCDDFSNLSAAINAFLADKQIEQLSDAAIAVATPVVGDQIQLTNNHWSFSIEKTRKQLGMNRLHVVNDFTALALSVPHLPSHEIVQVGDGSRTPDHAIAVIGPGTGLGVSGLIPCAGHWTALQGEGGHVSLGVRTAREFAVYEVLTREFRHVSAERFLSGPGLVNIFNALRVLDGLEAQSLSPAEITQKGIAHDDSTCSETLQIFCQLLGSCAGNLVLTLGAEGGVYIGGGIVPKLGDFFVQSDFRAHFEAKGRMQSYLEKIPSFVIDSPYPALTGAAQLLS